MYKNIQSNTVCNSLKTDANKRSRDSRTDTVMNVYSVKLHLAMRRTILTINNMGGFH